MTPSLSRKSVYHSVFLCEFQPLPLINHVRCHPGFDQIRFHQVIPSQNMLICSNIQLYHVGTHIDNQILHRVPNAFFSPLGAFTFNRNSQLQPTTPNSLGRVSHPQIARVHTKKASQRQGDSPPMRNTNTRNSEAALPSVFATSVQSASTGTRFLCIRCRAPRNARSRGTDWSRCTLFESLLLGRCCSPERGRPAHCVRVLRAP